MQQSLGKKFEKKFMEDFSKLPESDITRLYDSMSGNKGVRNISDFICYKYPYHFYIETKSHKGKSFPLSNLSQYDKLKTKVGTHGVRVGVVLWLIECDKVVYIPINTITQLKSEGKKSYSVKMINNPEYRDFEIPSTKLRTFMDSDYSILMNTEDGD